MPEIKSPQLYRYFQKLALIVGLVLSGTGWAIGNTETTYAGLIISLHGLIALVILLIEDRRNLKLEE